MAPVLRALEAKGALSGIIFTGQHSVTMSDLLREFGVRTRPSMLYPEMEVTGVAEMVRWFFGVLYRAVKQRRDLFPARGRASCVIVHGDTVSTLLGALIGRLIGASVVHVESGLRSSKLLDPFPEEMTRRLVFRMVDIAFCPGDWAFLNMCRYRVDLYNTGYNTLLDSIKMARDRHAKIDCHVPSQPFGVVSIHRFSTIFSRERFESVIELIEETALSYKVVFVLHPSTKNQLIKFSYYERLRGNKNIKLVDRMGFFSFIKLLSISKFAITDGGSNQEELFYLGKPTLIMRAATERQEGLYETSVICEYERNVVRDFIENLNAYERSDNILSESVESPSNFIVNVLMARFLGQTDEAGNS